MKAKSNYVLPTSLDDDDTFRKKSNVLMNKLIPTSVVPAATSNALLIVGSRDNEEACQVSNVSTFLLISGVMSLGMGVLGGVFKYVLQAILLDKKVTLGELNIIRFLDLISDLIVLVELGILIAGTVIMWPLFVEKYHSDLDKWEWKNVTRNGEKVQFCPQSTVLFSTSFTAGIWVLIILTSFAFIAIKAADISTKKKSLRQSRKSV